jgi:diguanylate cyclase (GGDEF)-like protein
MPISLDTIQPKHLGAAYPMFCHFLRLVALGLNREKVVLVAKIGDLKPAVLSCGGISHQELAAIVRSLPLQQATARTGFQTSPGQSSLALKSGNYSIARSHQLSTDLLIGQIHAPGIPAKLVVYVPGILPANLSNTSQELLQPLSQQLVYGLSLCHHQRRLPYQVSHTRQNDGSKKTTRRTPIIATCKPLLRPGSNLSTAKAEAAAQWVELFSELQSCLSFKQLKQLLETYLPLLLPQHIARLIAMGGAANHLSIVTQWGDSGKAYNPTMECAFSKESATREDDGFNLCHRCQDAIKSDPGFVCIVLGVLEQKAYILQLFLPNAIILSPERISLIQHLSKQLQAVMQRLQLVEDLQTKASQDPLTGLENRRYMQTMLDTLCHNSSPNFQISVILIDIDHFKSVNDTYGHQAGDAVLKDISILLKGHVRTKDLVCRYGGEEFCMILLDTSIEVALKRSEKIRRAVKYLNVFFAGQPLRSLTVSIGVAQFPIHGATPDELIAKADKALYWAKNHGRDQSVSFEEVSQSLETVVV